MDRVEESQADYRGAGFLGRIGPGAAPVVLVVDVVEAYLGDGPLTDPGGRFESARASAARVVDAARAAGHPVVFTEVRLAPGGVDAGWFAVKVPGLRAFEVGSPYAAFPDDPAPRSGEVVISKQYASAFFGTSLASTLRAMGVDTTYVVGFSTSGCVRASALDALQHGFRPLVIAEACGDRDAAIHDQNLFDLDAKYADVIGEAEAIDQLSSIPPCPPPALTPGVRS
jgi:maleamate amidohydrolase